MPPLCWYPIRSWFIRSPFCVISHITGHSILNNYMLYFWCTDTLLNPIYSPPAGIRCSMRHSSLPISSTSINCQRIVPVLCHTQLMRHLPRDSTHWPWIDNATGQQYPTLATWWFSLLFRWSLLRIRPRLSFLIICWIRSSWILKWY